MTTAIVHSYGGLVTPCRHSGRCPLCRQHDYREDPQPRNTHGTVTQQTRALRLGYLYSSDISMFASSTIHSRIQFARLSNKTILLNEDQLHSSTSQSIPETKTDHSSNSQFSKSNTMCQYARNIIRCSNCWRTTMGGTTKTHTCDPRVFHAPDRFNTRDNPVLKVCDVCNAGGRPLASKPPPPPTPPLTQRPPYAWRRREGPPPPPTPPPPPPKLPTPPPPPKGPPLGWRRRET